MTLSQQVCSLELAKRLKELGISQKSLFYHVKLAHRQGRKTDTKKIISPPPHKKWVMPKDFCSAFTASELGEMLPDRLLGMLDESTFETTTINEPEGDEWSKKIEEGYEIMWLEINVTSRSGGHDGWQAHYNSDGLECVEGKETKTQVETMGLMWCHLKEQGLIK